MKNVYKARIFGTVLAAFILGVVAKHSFTIGVLSLFIAPIAVLWFMSYDEAKYKKFEEGQSWKTSVKN